MTLVKNLKKAIALVLCLGTVFSVMSLSVSAASVSASLGYNEAEDSGDYAYWNGSKVVKSSSTTKDEIKWMQAALNRCISKEGLSATKLTIDGSFGPASKKATIAFQKAVGLSADGSFGPATIKKMKSILNDNKDNSLKPNQNTTTASVTEYNLIWPTTTKNITGKYGTHGSTRSNGTRYHSGIDIGSKIGDPCYAVADGEVVMCKSTEDSKSTIGGRGRYIVIYHSNGNYSSLYEHLDSCSVKVGDKVKAGQKIGTTGNSGWQSNNTHYDAHLHFGLMNGKMTTTGYDLWTVPGKTYNGKTYSNNTFEPDPNYNKNVTYNYK